MCSFLFSLLIQCNAHGHDDCHINTWLNGDDVCLLPANEFRRIEKLTIDAGYGSSGGNIRDVGLASEKVAFHLILDLLSTRRGKSTYGIGAAN